MIGNNTTLRQFFLWNSTWYCDHNYNNLLFEDIRFSYYFKSLFSRLRYPTSHLGIRRYGNLLTVIKATIKIPFISSPIKKKGFKKFLRSKNKGYIFTHFFFAKSVFYIYNKISSLIFLYFRKKSHIYIHPKANKASYMWIRSISRLPRARPEKLIYVNEESEEFDSINKVEIKIREDVVFYLKKDDEEIIEHISKFMDWSVVAYSYTNDSDLRSHSTQLWKYVKFFSSAIKTKFIFTPKHIYYNLLKQIYTHGFEFKNEFLFMPYVIPLYLRVYSMLTKDCVRMNRLARLTYIRWNQSIFNAGIDPYTAMGEDVDDIYLSHDVTDNRFKDITFYEKTAYLKIKRSHYNKRPKRPNLYNFTKTSWGVAIRKRKRNYIKRLKRKRGIRLKRKKKLNSTYKHLRYRLQIKHRLYLKNINMLVDIFNNQVVKRNFFMMDRFKYIKHFFTKIKHLPLKGHIVRNKLFLREFKSAKYWAMQKLFHSYGILFKIFNIRTYSDSFFLWFKQVLDTTKYSILHLVHNKKKLYFLNRFKFNNDLYKWMNLTIIKYIKYFSNIWLFFKSTLNKGKNFFKKLINTVFYAVKNTPYIINNEHHAVTLTSIFDNVEENALSLNIKPFLYFYNNKYIDKFYKKRNYLISKLVFSHEKGRYSTIEYLLKKYKLHIVYVHAPSTFFNFEFCNWFYYIHNYEDSMYDILFGKYIGSGLKKLKYYIYNLIIYKMYKLFLYFTIKIKVVKIKILKSKVCIVSIKNKLNNIVFYSIKKIKKEFKYFFTFIKSTFYKNFNNLSRLIQHQIKYNKNLYRSKMQFINRTNNDINISYIKSIIQDKYIKSKKKVKTSLWNLLYKYKKFFNNNTKIAKIGNKHYKILKSNLNNKKKLSKYLVKDIYVKLMHFIKKKLKIKIKNRNIIKSFLLKLKHSFFKKNIKRSSQKYTAIRRATNVKTLHLVDTTNCAHAITLHNKNIIRNKSYVLKYWSKDYIKKKYDYKDIKKYKKDKGYVKDYKKEYFNTFKILSKYLSINFATHTLPFINFDIKMFEKKIIMKHKKMDKQIRINIEDYIMNTKDCRFNLFEDDVTDTSTNPTMLDKILKEEGDFIAKYLEKNYTHLKMATYTITSDPDARTKFDFYRAYKDTIDGNIPDDTNIYLDTSTINKPFQMFSTNTFVNNTTSNLKSNDDTSNKDKTSSDINDVTIDVV